MTVTVNIIKISDVARCPKLSMLPAHYKQDGTCWCSQAPELKARIERLRRQRAKLLAEIKTIEVLL